MSSAAAAFARTAGPRTTGSETVVASPISPLRSMMLASATMQSSHGISKTRWSFALMKSYPS
jgi:hypothetical protein